MKEYRMKATKLLDFWLKKNQSSFNYLESDEIFISLNLKMKSFLREFNPWNEKLKNSKP